MGINKAILVSAAILCVSPFSAFAGPYTNDLAKCLVESTSPGDRTDLVKWMFSAASAHPAVKSISNVSAKQLDKANKKTADLFMKLLTVSCRSETEKALKYEGKTTLQVSFQVLGQVAGKELFASPEVSAAMSGLERHLDEKRLQSLVQKQ